MTKLEKSIRSQLKFYGPRLRNGHYGVAGYTTGWVPKDYSKLKSMHCDVDGGIVTDIRLYAVGDAMSERDYYGDSIDITEPVKDYLRGGWDWDAMIADIAAIVADRD